MKRLVIVGIALLLIAAPAPAKQMVKVKPPKVEVKQKVKTDHNVRVHVNPNIEIDLDPGFDINIDPDIDIDIDPGVHVDVSGIMGHFGNWDDDDQTQQDTQEIEIPLSSPGERGKLEVESHNGRVTIEAYNGPTVKVKMIKYGKKVDRESSSGGLRRVGGGTFDIEAQEYRNTVKLENDGWGNRVDFEIQVPKNFDVKAESYNNGHILIRGLEGQLEVESYNGPITLENITGAASASTYNGAIKVLFDGVTANTPMAFSTYNGDVDLTIPGSTKITAKMKTNRDIYTDFENFTISDPKPAKSNGRNGNFRIKFEDWTEGNVNGGGPEVMMKTTNGNIYIRKNG